MEKKDLQKQAIEKRKSRDRTRREQEILEAASKVFLNTGYLRVTMDDIALEAGLTKPTIYKYFKSKDHLCYALMTPVIDAIRDHLEQLEKDLLAGKYQSGAQIIHDTFQAYYQGQKLSPDSFRLIQFFQQSGVVWNLDPELRKSLNEKGKHNARVSRRTYRVAMEKGLLKEQEAIVVLDVFYGAFLGIIQITDIRSHRTGIKAEQAETEANLLQRLEFMEKIAIEALIPKPIPR